MHIIRRKKSQLHYITSIYQRICIYIHSVFYPNPVRKSSVNSKQCLFITCNQSPWCHIIYRYVVKIMLKKYQIKHQKSKVQDQEDILTINFCSSVKRNSHKLKVIDMINTTAIWWIQGELRQTEFGRQNDFVLLVINCFRSINQQYI